MLKIMDKNPPAMDCAPGADIRQSTDTVLMVRPHAFTPNPQTAADNSFQCESIKKAEAEIAKLAYEEVSAMVSLLETKGITVHLFEDDGRNGTPDSVFPNNWITTYCEGLIGVHAMYAQNRRKERREDVLDFFQSRYDVIDVIDDSKAAEDGKYLEGTGVLILDRLYKIAYMCRSMRTNEELLEKYCRDFGFAAMAFDASDENGTPIYHTNVMMCLGTNFALIGLDCIKDDHERARVVHMLESTGREIIEISQEQIAAFAGNALELQGAGGKLLAISSTAFGALSEEQKARIEQYAELLPIDIPTIELAGGSVRCMLAEVFLSAKL